MEQMKTDENSVQIRKSKEIDVVALLKKVLKEKRLLAIFFAVGAVLGIIVALAMPKAYTSNVALAPESNDEVMKSGLSDIASSFGVDVGSMLGSMNSDDAIYPEIYPEVFASTDFIIPLLEVPVRTKDNPAPVTYRKHLEQFSRPFWDYLKSWVKKPFQKKDLHVEGGGCETIVLSRHEEELIEGVRGAISCIINKKTSIINISVTDQDPLVAAILADTLQARLQEYIINYRTKKAQNDFAYYKKMTDEAEARYKEAQRAYSSYADSHQELVLESYNQRQSSLENDMQLKYNIYTQLLLQRQRAEAKIQEATPAFVLLENAYVSNQASSTPRSLVVIVFVFLACCADVLWVLWLRPFFKK
ncbi:MAG: Wzz/FepE/Etk N-terminal domain-containing protein [Prevotella sp.]|nr:Wzz/FepE/Etk N-terminal domain-containing protein [Prevotella sp.]